MRRALVVLVVAGTLVAACSSGDDTSTAAPSEATSTSSTETSTSSTSSSTTTTTEAPGTTVPPEDERPYEHVVETLAADAMKGRDNGSPGSRLAQDLLIDQLETFAEPLGGSYRQRFPQGTNILAVIPGVDLPDEYVILGAHYDHLGTECEGTAPADDICNGAADNAAGTASVLEIGRRIAEGDPPARSVVLAFWDAEEDGLLGSLHYVENPVVPLDQTITYLNWDMQGVNLLPSLRDITFLIGAESGGPDLVEAVDEATTASDLETLTLSLLFGQGRSDYAAFVGKEVPTAFFSDSTAGCYHTVDDEVEHVDMEKLGKQIANGEALTRELAASDRRPEFVSGTPIATYEDALSVLAVVDQGLADVERLSPEAQEFGLRFLADLQAIADAGPEAFDDAATQTLIGGAAEIVDLLTQSDCDGFLR